MGRPESLSHSRNDTGPPGSADMRHRKSLLSQSERWLQHANVKKTSLSSKMTFLKQKGLREEELRSLLRRDTESNENTRGSPAKSALGDDGKQEEEAEFCNDVDLSQPEADTQATSPEEKPIVLYPELSPVIRQKLKTLVQNSPWQFLIHSAPYTVSVTATITGIICATSKYILHPKIVRLMTIRQDLAEFTHTQLKELNSRLENYKDGKGLTKTAPEMGIRDLDGVVRIAKSMIFEAELAIKEAQTQSNVFFQHREGHENEENDILDIPKSALLADNRDITQLSLLTAYLCDLLPVECDGEMEHTGITALGEDILDLQRLIQRLQQRCVQTSHHTRTVFPILKTTWAKAKAAEGQEEAGNKHDVGRGNINVPAAETAVYDSVSAVKQEIAGVKSMLLPQLTRGPAPRSDTQ